MKDLQKDSQLNDLISNMFERPETLAQNDNSGAGARDVGMKETPHEPTKGKPLLIPDFVTKSYRAEPEVPLFKAGSGVLAWQPSKNPKISVEKVTVAQWTAANGRIMKKLLKDGISYETLMDYIEYTTKVGDYLQQYTVSSVMILDDVHRRYVAEENVAWSDVNKHFKDHYLVSIQEPSRVKSGWSKFRNRPTQQ
ncbi:unnamed protein product [Owenia fusiformis]|uniref:Uncharacterized protein n=1 Tax=Owenia fusiformis TaxID=6347 RepID=A0A8J1T5D3_OWEFU|nr:unnamed protein product [Owenia fusiformis]